MNGLFKENKDFYPTPSSLFRQLMNGNRRLHGRILEPSAGKGDMVKYIKGLTHRNDNVRIDAIENDNNLIPFLREEDKVGS